MSDTFKTPLNTETKFLFSTSSSNSSIPRHNTAIQKPGLNLCYFTFLGDITSQDIYRCY